MNIQITPKSYFLFSGGEVHCSLKNKIPQVYGAEVELICTDYTMNGFMAVCQYKEVLDRCGAIVHLTYPYFPYARQDRIMNDEEPFSLKIFCELLNSRKFASVTILDAHSDVAIGLIDNVRFLPQWNIAKEIIPKEYFDNRNVLFVSPDAGAYKKLAKLITDDTRIVIGVKHRAEDGKITHTNVFSPTEIQGKVCVIVDDICDGGRTFIELAKVLKERGATKVILYITHGIFSQGFGELQKYIDHIYTTNSFGFSSNDYLTVGAANDNI